MTPERWQRVKQIFDSAVEYAPVQRSAFLAGACGGDDDLRSEVESLIASHEKTGTFIDSPAYEAVAHLIADEKAEFKQGQVVGSYEIVSFISRGGMGEIYLAQDRRLNRKVALKILPVSFTRNMDRLCRFEQEARAASALNHPNIITIYEILKTHSTHVIATEFVEGETLRQRLARAPTNLNESLFIAIHVADALAAAHAAGIVHRDIKPENIMIRPDGYVKVLDFGLAKLAEDTASVTAEEALTKQVRTGSGMILGTAGYMSPEQARGKAVDARSDIFSLGSVIYEMVTGCKPFDGETPSDTLAAILNSNPGPITDYLPQAPPELSRILTKALRKDREERYQVIKDLLLDLKTLKEELDFQAKLDGSASSSKAREGAAAIDDAQGSLAGTASSSTSEIKTAVSTITHSLSVEIKRHKTASILAASVIAAALVACVALIYRFVNRTPSAATSKASQVLHTAQIPTPTGLEIPALSPDGNSIAYSSNPGGGAMEIYVKPLTPGAREIQLTSDGQGNSDPAWSPDARLIAFRSEKRGGIWVIPATGGAARQLTDFGAWPAWSADSSSIAFQSDSTSMPPTTVWTVSLQGGDPIQITKTGNPPGGHSLPSWSPDGKRIVFVAYNGAREMEMWTVAAKGGDPKQVIKSRSWFSSPVYSPNGEYVYSGGVTENGNLVLYQLHVSPATGEALGEPVIVADTGLARIQGRLTLSADGKKLAYSARISTGDLVSVPISPTSGEVVGSPKPMMQSTSYRKTMPRFSRDGRKIAFLQFRAGENQKIWVMDADGGNVTQLTTGPSVDWSPSWFPDSDTITFLSNDEGQPYQRMWSVSVSTGRKKLLLDPGQDIGWPRLSPDGKQIAFNSTKSGTINVWVVPVEGGTPRQLTFDGESTGWPCWSPDGKLLAIERQRGMGGGIATMPSTGGEITQLTFDRGRQNDWSPDGDKIVFVAQRGGVSNIYWVSRSTKQEKQLTHYTKQNLGLGYPEWSPLGNQIVYEYSETTGNIWLMELK